MVLREISENLEPRREKNGALGDASTAVTVTPGSKQDSPDE
jgi:hypothetical protein